MSEAEEDFGVPFTDDVISMIEAISRQEKRDARKSSESYWRGKIAGELEAITPIRVKGCCFDLVSKGEAIAIARGQG